MTIPSHIERGFNTIGMKKPIETMSQIVSQEKTEFGMDNTCESKNEDSQSLKGESDMENKFDSIPGQIYILNPPFF